MFKPLQNYANFQPTKACSDYVAQDCAAAMPALQRMMHVLMRECKEVASCILNAGRACGLSPMQTFALVRPACTQSLHSHQSLKAQASQWPWVSALKAQANQCLCISLSHWGWE